MFRSQARLSRWLRASTTSWGRRLRASSTSCGGAQGVCWAGRAVSREASDACAKDEGSQAGRSDAAGDCGPTAAPASPGTQQPPGDAAAQQSSSGGAAALWSRDICGLLHAKERRSRSFSCPGVHEDVEQPCTRPCISSRGRQQPRRRLPVTCWLRRQQQPPGSTHQIHLQIVCRPIPLPSNPGAGTHDGQYQQQRRHPAAPTRSSCGSYRSSYRRPYLRSSLPTAAWYRGAIQATSGSKSLARAWRSGGVRSAAGGER